MNKKRLQEYPNLWGYTRELFKTDAFYEFTKLDEIKKHYQLSPHMRAKQGNVFGLVGTGPDYRELFEATDRKKLSNDEDNLYIYEQNTGFYSEYYSHKDVKTEIKYLNKFVLEPIKKASESTFQTDLNRWNANLIDALKQIDKRLDKSKYLLSDEISDADIVKLHSLHLQGMQHQGLKLVEHFLRIGWCSQTVLIGHHHKLIVGFLAKKTQATDDIRKVPELLDGIDLFISRFFQDGSVTIDE